MAATKKARIVLTVQEEFCKGCGLCVDFCPQHAMQLQERMDSRGFHPAHLADPERCTGCAQCAVMCPDACIRIVRITEAEDE
jgi:2-oxoglutarate ferredoxin oxidoreductase subunit delta